MKNCGIAIACMRVFCVAVVLLQGCGSGGTPPGALTAAANGAANSVFVTQVPNLVGPGSILQFSATANGIMQPVSTLVPPGAQFTLEALAVDSRGLVYVGGRTPTPYSTIYVFAAAASGSASPIRTLQIASGANPGEIAFDSAGNIYVAADAEIDVFSPTASTPYRVISGTQTQLTEINGIAVNSSGEIFVTNAITGTGSVFVYSATANGNAAPVRTISGVGGSTFDTPSGIALDAAGNLYVGSFLSSTPAGSPASIFEFAPSVSGFPTPINTIAGSATGLVGIGTLKLDGAGNLYVVIITTKTNANGTTYEPSLAVFAPGAKGNVVPTRSFTSPAWTSTGYGQVGLE